MAVVADAREKVSARDASIFGQLLCIGDWLRLSVPWAFLPRNNIALLGIADREVLQKPVHGGGFILDARRRGTDLCCGKNVEQDADDAPRSWPAPRGNLRLPGQQRSASGRDGFLSE